AKDVVVIFDRSQDYQAGIDAQRLGCDNQVWSPGEMFAGRAAQVTFAARRRAVLAGQVVHQVGAATAMLTGPQVNIVEHLLEPFLETLITSCKALFDGLQIGLVCQSLPGLEGDSPAVGAIQQQVIRAQAY